MTKASAINRFHNAVTFLLWKTRKAPTPDEPSFLFGRRRTNEEPAERRTRTKQLSSSREVAEERRGRQNASQQGLGRPTNQSDGRAIIFPEEKRKSTKPGKDITTATKLSFFEKKCLGKSIDQSLTRYLSVKDLKRSWRDHRFSLVAMPSAALAAASLAELKQRLCHREK